MNWKEHLGLGYIIGMLCFFIFYFTGIMDLGFKSVIFLILITFIYSLAPDLDIQSSKPRQIITLLGLILILYFNFTSNELNVRIISIVLLIIWTLPLFDGFGHRGHYHSLLFGLLISLPLIYFSYTFAIIGLATFLSHTISDDDFKLW